MSQTLTATTDANGRYKVDPTTGQYLLSGTANDQVVGNREPDFIAGFNNTFRYKKFILSFLLDIRKGGERLDIVPGAEAKAGDRVQGWLTAFFLQ